MTNDDLLSRLRVGEDTLTELKTMPHESDVKRALVAFANSAPPERAGVLFLGAKRDGTPVGLENATSVGEKVAIWADECYPRIGFECVTFQADGRDILAIVVRASSDRPHFGAPAYVRDGPRTVKAPPEVYDDLIASRNTKAGAILRQKGEVVTVILQRRWPATWNAPEKVVPHAPQECRIESCSAHSVELRYLASSRLTSLPLDRVILTADPEHHRPLMLIITPS